MTAQGPGGPGPQGPLRVPFRTRTRLVGWAKIILPLAALALLSTLFLLAREPAGGEPAIPVARIEEIAREERVGGARLAGVAPDGTAVAVSADRLAPMPARPGAWIFEAPRFRALTPDGVRLSAAAAEGEAGTPGERLRLSGAVEVQAHSIAAGAWHLRAPVAEADLATGTLLAPDGIAGEAPWGDFEAGALEARRGTGGEGARLVFTGGVRLLYEPGSAADGG
jgi:lipopolysaccharide export system protein LptC